MLENQNPANENPTDPKELQKPQESKPNLDVDHWNGVKDKTLEKHGFPRHAWKHTKVIYIMEFDENGEDESYLCLIYNETGRLEDSLGWEAFKTEEEFEEACRKTAGYHKETHEARLAGLEHAIKDFQEKTERVWTHKPQKKEGTYAFDGKGLITIGVRENLSPEEVRLILSSIRRRLTKKKLDVQNRTKEAVGLDYLQVFDASDGTKVFAIDQLDHGMKKEESEEFVEEYNTYTFMLAHEY